MSAQTKLCAGRCARELPLEAFRRKGGKERPNRRVSTCRECEATDRLLASVRREGEAQTRAGAPTPSEAPPDAERARRMVAKCDAVLAKRGVRR